MIFLLLILNFSEGALTNSMNRMNGSHKVGEGRLENRKLESTERSRNELK